MYIPPHFEETQIAVMHELMKARPLATLVTLSEGGMEANHIPLHLSPEEGSFGTLRGHVARSNSMWRAVAGDAEGLAIFHGADSYISPSWYPTKQEHGRAVPTWNYAVVHARGAIRIVDDAIWLRGHLEALTSEHEATLSEPWAMTDAPADFIDRLVGAVVGIEIVIEKLTGKWKISQNQPPQNRDGVIRALEARGSMRSLEMAELIRKSIAEGE